LSALKRITLIVIGLALVVGLRIGGQSLIARQGKEVETLHAPPAAEVPTNKAPSGKPDQAQSEAPPQIRRVAPGSIAEPEITGPLERIAPREPLTAAIKPLKREPFGPPVPRGTLLYRPVAPAAGEIAADGYTVRLAGIKVTPADRTCSDEAGKQWPCGAMARTAFRAWMRGRAAACDVPSKPTGITTHCTLDGEDMALWLVRNGWAESAGGQYGDAETEAKREKKGMFGASPIGTAPQ
jgi:endonuclease YncB( thermonuclease family)